MINPCSLPGVFVLDLTISHDERGSFTRTFDRDSLESAGLSGRAVQAGTAVNTRARTLRGMHLQEGEHAENKVVRCTRGALFDVVVDLRRGSPAFGHWEGFELSDDEPRAVYVPAGCAHGYLTLVDGTEVAYTMDSAYRPAAASGVRYDDPDLAIAWPAEPSVISPRDLQLPSLAARTG